MRLGLASFLLLMLTAWAVTASARSGGGEVDGWAETVRNNDGCTCHGNGSPTSATAISLKNWPSKYVPGQSYVLELSSTTDVPQTPLEVNHGGFLAWADQGELLPTPGTQPWVEPGTYSSGGSWIAHNSQGDVKNGQQKWNFTWTAPNAGTGTVTLKTYVNRVNGNNGADGGDHWNKRTYTSTEGSGAPTSVFPTPSRTTSSAAAAGTEPPTESPSGTRVDLSPGTGGAQPGVGVAATLVVAGLAAFFAGRRAT